MKIKPFALEQFFAKYEFSARYLLSCSDCEPLAMSELLEMAEEETGRLWNELKLSYTETRGHPLLREAIAEIYHGLSSRNILVGVPEECIFLTMQSLLNPGDHVICTFPGYQSLYEIARAIGCTVSFWEVEEKNRDGHGGRWHLDMEKLTELLRPNTRLLVVNFPHNPTGFVPVKQMYEKIVQIAAERGIWLFSDEMYRFLEYEKTSTPASGCELYERAVSLFGLSKTFGLPGLRIGWLACRDQELLETISRLKDYTTICNSAPSEILALMALRRRENIIERHVVRSRKNLKLLESFTRDRKDLISLSPPDGGSVCFPRLLFTDDAESFCDRLVKEAGIMLLPSTMFEYGNRHVRIGFGRENFPEVLEKFSEYLTGAGLIT